MAEMSNDDKSNDEIIEEILGLMDTVKEKMFTAEERMLLEDTVSNREEYEQLMEKYSKYQEFDDIINDVGYHAGGQSFWYNGYCPVCGQNKKLYYKGRPQKDVRDGISVHFFREWFFCLDCGCNGRLRFMVQKIRKEYKSGMKVYMYERITATYRAASQFIPAEDLIGSEYFGPEYKSGEYVNDILHEDAAALSFEDNSFDLMVSMDVFEHTYYYKEVFQEVYRVLKPGGKLLLTIPMRPLLDETVERAKIVDGEIVHIMEPLMHGDPMSPEGGVLEFIMYGWDIIPYMKSVGFSDVKMNTYYSVNDAYLGCIPYYFELTK